MAEYVYLQVGSIKIKKLFDGEDDFLGRWQIIFVVLYSKLFKIREEAPQLCDFVVVLVFDFQIWICLSGFEPCASRHSMIVQEEWRGYLYVVKTFLVVWTRIQVETVGFIKGHVKINNFLKL